jgi:hypothetical protein
MHRVRRPSTTAITAATLGLAFVGIYACSGNSPAASSAFGCSLSLAGQQYCYAYSGLSSDQDKSARQACPNLGGSIVSSCPTDNLVGCCAVTSSGISAQDCYYFGTSSTDQTACTAGGGTWSDGHGAIGGSSGGASGGSTSSGGSASTLGCSVDLSGEAYCYLYSNLTTAEDSTARQDCSSQGGSVVSSCPTDNLVGCCAVTASGVTAQACYYFGTASADQMACTTAGGTWTDGSGALTSPNGGSSGAGTSSSGGSCTAGDLGCACYPNNTCNGSLTCTSGVCTNGTAPTCSAASGGPVCCPQGYCTLGTAHGYAFAYSDMNDGGSSSASLASDGTLCVHGTSVGAVCSDQTCFSSYWGAGMGVNVNQASGTSSPVANYPAAGSTGVTYALDSLPPNTRLVVGDSTTDYCVTLNAASGSIPWTNFNSACWDGSGTSLSGPPASFTSVRFQVASDDVNGGFSDFNFCVDRLGF